MVYVWHVQIRSHLPYLDHLLRANLKSKRNKKETNKLKMHATQQINYEKRDYFTCKIENKRKKMFFLHLEQI